MDLFRLRQRIITMADAGVVREKGGRRPLIGKAGAGPSARGRHGSSLSLIANWMRCVFGLLRGKAAPQCGSKLEKRYHLHLGVHKTGTTYTQTVLMINRDNLKRAGVEYWDLGYTRRNLTPFLVGLSRRKASLSPTQCRERIESLIYAPEISAAKRVVISDENLLGFIFDIIRKNGYKNLVRKLTPMRGVLGGDVKVFLTVRSYADFISSMYCELITTKPYFTFERIREGKFVSGLSWAKVYRDLVKVFGAENVVVCDYQTVFSHLTEFLSFLADARIDFELPKKEIRSSPSARAVGFIRTESEEHPELPVRKVVARAILKFPRNSENPQFDPWTAEERAALDERYKRDMAEIPCWRPGGIG